MRLSKINRQQMGGPARQAPEPAPEAPAGRSLIALAPAAPLGEPISQYRQQAPFLAQLIATREQLPQTRERRRAEPEEAIAAYRAMSALIPSS
jgi:hypothetical protein